MCFERMVVPLIRYTPCGHVFMEPKWAPTMMHNFRRHLYRTMNITPPAAFPRTITYLHRATNRRIVNRHEALQMLQTFGWEVKVVETELHKPFSEQVCDRDGVAAQAEGG